MSSESTLILAFGDNTWEIPLQNALLNKDSQQRDQDYTVEF